MQTSSNAFINSPHLEEHLKELEKLYLDDKIHESIEYVKYLGKRIIN